MNLPRVLHAERTVLVLAVLAGLFVGFVDAVLDYFLFYEGTFLELLVTNVPEREIYIRSVILAAFVVFGLIASRSIARRKRTEDALRESERAMATLLSNLPGMAYRCLDDPDWTTLFVSEGAKDLTGYDLSELTGNKRTSYGEIIHRDDRDAVWTEVQEALASDRPFELAYRIVTREGKERWVWEQGGQVARTDDGTGILEGFITDITERKKAEKELRLKDVVFESSIAANSTADIDGIIDHVNPAFLRMWGYDEEAEAIGKPVSHFFEDEKEAAPVLESLSRTGRWHGRFLARRKDGTTFISEGLATVVRNEQGELLGYQSANLDVTQRERTEQALRASEQRYRELFSSMGSGVAVYEVLGNGDRFIFKDINAAGRRITNTADTDIVGRGVTDVFPDVARFGLLDVFKEVWATGQPKHHPVSLYQDERLQAWYENYVYRLPTGDIVAVFDDVTARKETEKALRESEEKFRLLVESQSDMVVEFDNEGRLQFVSPSYCRVFGKSEQELAGSTFMPLIHENDREAVARAIESVQQPPHNSYVEERALTVEGWRWQAWVNSAVLNEQNEVVGIVASGRDVTERKQAEEALRESERNLAEAQRMAHLGSWKWDIGTGQVEWSREVYRIFGLDPEEFRPDIDSVMSRVHPEDRDKHETLIDQAIADREQCDIDARIRLPDGTIRNIVSTSQGIYDSQGNLTQLSGAIQDVTERKQAEESLHIRVRQLAALNSLSSRVGSRLDTDQIVHLALEGMVEQLQTDLAILFLRTDGELGLAGVRPDLSRFDGETMPVHRVGECLCGRAISQQQPIYSLEISDDPRCTWEECKRAGFQSFAALPLVSGDEIFGVLGLASEAKRDFGEEAAFLETLANEIAVALHNARLYEEVRRHTRELTDANEQIRRLNVELERRVEQRTAELRAANEELEAFVYSVSHDLRAPLRAMEGFARALVEDCAENLNADGREFCQHIVDSAIDMDGLIKDLLAYSRIGRTELHLQAVGLEGVVAEAIEQLQPSFTSSKAEIIVDGQLPNVRAHPATLRQVVANLLSNGVKFVRPDERPTIRIWAEPQADMVRLWVEDNGIGIDEEYQTRIFHVFERLHGVERYPGTGIGLAIVQRATERMGGRCGVESTLGHGSRFWVEYPQHTREQKAT